MTNTMQDVNSTYLNKYATIHAEEWAKVCAEEHKPQLWFGGVTIALIVIGLIGNIIVLVTIITLQEYKKSVTNWYILQLSVADTLFLLMLPFTAHSAIVGTWNFSLHLCKFKEGILFINYYASIYFLVVMSFDRYLAVTKALDSNSWATSLRSPTASYIISIFGWIISVVLCIQLFQYSVITECKTCAYIFPPDEPPKDPNDFSGDYSGGYSGGYSEEFVGNNSEDEYYDNNYAEVPGFIDYIDHKKDNDTDGNITYCKHPKNRSLSIWVYGNFFGAFVLPFVLICFFYGMIMMTIYGGGKVGNTKRQNSYRKRVTRIVASLVTLFLISWLPWYIEKIAKFNGIPHLSRFDCKQMSSTVRILAYLNSAFNPYFYSFLGTHFRERLIRASSKVGLTAALQSRTAAVSQKKNRKFSTSNSGGSSGKCHKQSSVHKCGQAQSQGYDNKVATCSVIVKTERTDLVL